LLDTPLTLLRVASRIIGFSCRKKLLVNIYCSGHWFKCKNNIFVRDINISRGKLPVVMIERIAGKFFGHLSDWNIMIVDGGYWSGHDGMCFQFMIRSIFEMMSVESRPCLKNWCRTNEIEWYWWYTTNVICRLLQLSFKKDNLGISLNNLLKMKLADSYHQRICAEHDIYCLE